MFIWTEKYSVGVRELDEQHRHFIAIANEALTLEAKKDATRIELVDLLDEFLNYALYHLANEEGYFEKFGCPQLGHVEAHNAFRTEYRRIYNEARNSDMETLHRCAGSAARYAGRWLLEHILVMDKGYTRCFNEHGLK